MKHFKGHIYSHLSKYKNENITSKNGFWREKEYQHILPNKSDYYKLNILEHIRDDFWNYFEGKNLKKHPNFNHLNSSQALCFNLFFSLFYPKVDLLNLLFHKIFKIPTKLTIIDCDFEKILDKDESTNFDFYASLSDDYKILFEIKYTENEFGKAKKDENHIEKYHKIYKNKLSGKIKNEFNNSDYVLDNYQIMRNVSYLDDKTFLVFILPKENEKLKNLDKIINETLKSSLLNNVKIIYLEDLIAQILKLREFKEVEKNYIEFRKKYIE